MFKPGHNFLVPLAPTFFRRINGYTRRSDRDFSVCNWLNCLLFNITYRNKGFHHPKLTDDSYFAVGFEDGFASMREDATRTLPFLLDTNLLAISCHLDALKWKFDFLCVRTLVEFNSPAVQRVGDQPLQLQHIYSLQTIIHSIIRSSLCPSVPL
ncbi:hypothetical protein BV22DRAFT_457624 [Leucogyrophana mollusca]|uniref:Uncharacterized protein n=1 Tax=Leucogyrophana mollusca TaxID=85980 RepID=A0ACB8BJW6_9AGAM|nr:hypothetical protein BV22DRAFT_457624 [Leucogyrophana mollusca]